MKTLRRIADVQVFDAATLELQPELSREGFLTCLVNATRTGIFIYADDQGRPVRALRHDDDVFDPASTSTLPGKPITRTHPASLLDAATAKDSLVGATGDSVGRKKAASFDLLQVPAHIFDKATIDAIKIEGLKEVSCGYVSDVLDEPGVDAKYGPYDVRQTNIRYNHLAVAIEAGRGGPQVRMLLDSTALSFKQEPHMLTEAQKKILDAAKKDLEEAEAKGGLEKVDIGGEEHHMTPKLSSAIKGHMERMKSEHLAAHNELASQIKGLTGKKKEEDDEVEEVANANEGEEAQDADKVTAKMDSIKTTSKSATRIKAVFSKLQGTIKGLRTELKTKLDSAGPKAIADAAKGQARLVAVVAALTKDGKEKAAELFLMDALALKKMAILARDPKAVLDGKTTEYIDGQYDAVSAGVQINMGVLLGEALMGNAEVKVQDAAVIPTKGVVPKWTPPALTAMKPGFAEKK